MSSLSTPPSNRFTRKGDLDLRESASCLLTHEDAADVLNLVPKDGDERERKNKREEQLVRTCSELVEMQIFLNKLQKVVAVTGI